MATETQLSHGWLLAVPDRKPNLLPLDCKFDGLPCATTPPTAYVLSLRSVRYDCVIEYALLLMTDVKLLSWNEYKRQPVDLTSTAVTTSYIITAVWSVARRVTK